MKRPMKAAGRRCQGRAQIKPGVSAPAQTEESRRVADNPLHKNRRNGKTDEVLF